MDFIYLIQGQASLIYNYLQLRNRINSKALFLTYDNKIEGAFYLPNSTWAEGRNYLLSKAMGIKDQFTYFIFLDDDVKLIEGSYELFERQLLKHNPSIAVPIFIHKSNTSIISIKIFSKSINLFPTFQICKRADAQFIAFHKNVIHDNLVFPLQTQFDNISWWCTSSTQQLLIFNLYGRRFIQFNNIKIANIHHGIYPKNDFKNIQSDWFRKEFIKSIEDPRPYSINLFSISNIKKIYISNNNKIPLKFISTFFTTILLTIFYSKNSYSNLSLNKLESILKPSSEILKNYKKEC